MSLVLSPDHPRPQLQRAGWRCLDGVWEFAIDAPGEITRPECVRFDREILVPFSPETPRSGIGDRGYFKAVWYRRRFEAEPPENGERLMLRFGAVDYRATVWVNGRVAGTHQGGYTPFGFDITDLLEPDGPQEVIVRAEDDPHDLSKPRGKQDWQLRPHSIWYPRTTGIWQTVWLERLPRCWIDTLRWSASLENWDVAIQAIIGGIGCDETRLEIRLTVGEGQRTRLLAHDAYAAVSGEVHRRIAFSDPGIDDYRNELLWSPDSPNLIDARLRLLDADGTVLDEVVSYTALRAVGTQGDRFILNGRPFFLRMVLDQGYWPETGLTPPDAEALRRDVELAKAMGFNGIRKHQKLEDPRYYYWADRLGLLVWTEMPSAYRFTLRSVDRLTREWKDALLRDMSQPCVVTWVPFNESWGVPDLPSNPAQRDYVQALYHLTRTFDPSRPVIGNDGWESSATDMIGVHDYDDDPEKLRERYDQAEDIPHLFHKVRPAGRLIALDGHPHAGQPLILSEFGGVAFTPPAEEDRTWGYARAATADDFAARYAALVQVARTSSLLAGFCYTQFADTYQEANGLLYPDRRPKVPLEMIRKATAGPREARDLDLDEPRVLAEV